MIPLANKEYKSCLNKKKTVTFASWKINTVMIINIVELEIIVIVQVLYCHLIMEDITDSDYRHAKRV